MKKEFTSPSLYHFRFNDVPADPDLERAANLKLAQCLALAPPASKAVGIVERDDRLYVCAIEVSSPYRAFFEKAGGLTAESAVKRALEKIENQLYRWRYGGGNAGSSPESPFRFNQPLAQG